MAGPLALAERPTYPASIFEQMMPDQAPGYGEQAPAYGQRGYGQYEQAIPDDESDDAAAPSNAVVPEKFHRQMVSYNGSEPAGTIIIDTGHTFLYLVLGNGRALRYGIGVGREGFTWSGVQTIARKAEWPDWHPPAEMIARQPYLPRFMAGGTSNPLGARAMYLGNSLYRIHGTNDPSTIGKRVSSGCIRLTNADVEDLYSRVPLGSRVVVLPVNSSAMASMTATRSHGAQRAARTVAPRPTMDVSEDEADSRFDTARRSSPPYRVGPSASRLY